MSLRDKFSLYSFFNFLKKSLKLSFYIFLGLITFVIAFAGLVALLSKHIEIRPAFGISEAASFNNSYVEYSKSNVLPGSYVIIVKKDSPLFSYITNKYIIKAFRTVSLYSLVGAISLLVLSIVMLYKRKYIYVPISLGASVAFFVAAFLLNAPFTKGDIICYKPDKDSITIICHTFIGFDEKGNLILQSSRYKINETVPPEKVYGKIVAIIHPAIGKPIFILAQCYRFAEMLLGIINKGYIPVEYKIYYIPEK